jgi:glycosyltransferase involved in cell wall biosynthesis
MLPKLSVIIPTHARREMLRRNLEYLLTLSGPSLELIVIDDASTDGTREMLLEFPGVKVIRNEVSKGFDALPEAVRLAEADYIFELDDDAYPHPETFIKVLDHFEKRGESLGMIALPFIEPQSGRRVYSPYLPKISSAESYVPTRGFIAGAVAFRREAALEIPPSPPGYFMYATEPATTLEFLARDWEADYLPDALVYHVFEARKKIKPHHAYLPFRNDLVTIDRYYRGVTRWEMRTGRYLTGFLHLLAAGKPAEIFRVGEDAKRLLHSLGRQQVTPHIQQRIYPCFEGTTLRTLFSETTRRRVAYFLGLLPFDQAG